MKGSGFSCPSTFDGGLFSQKPRVRLLRSVLAVFIVASFAFAVAGCQEVPNRSNSSVGNVEDLPYEPSDSDLATGKEAMGLMIEAREQTRLSVKSLKDYKPDLAVDYNAEARRLYTEARAVSERIEDPDFREWMATFAGLSIRSVDISVESIRALLEGNRKAYFASAERGNRIIRELEGNLRSPTGRDLMRSSKFRLLIEEFQEGG